MSPLLLYISLTLHSGGINVEMSAVVEWNKLNCGVEKRNIPHDEWIMFGLPTWTAARRGAAQLSAPCPSIHKCCQMRRARYGDNVGEDTNVGDTVVCGEGRWP